jgi:hypothetical protein
MFGWFRRAPAPTDEQLRVAAALAGYPPYSPPKWTPGLEFLGDNSEAYREYFFANKHLRLQALGEFLAKFGVALELDYAGLVAVSTWLPRYADSLVDDFDSEVVRDAYREFLSPWTGALSGLNPIFDLGIYHAECVWSRRTKLKWIVVRGPEVGIATHAISGLPGGKLFDPMGWTYNFCRNIWVKKRKRWPFANNSLELESEVLYRRVLSEAPPGRRRRKQTGEKPSR